MNEPGVTGRECLEGRTRMAATRLSLLETGKQSRQSDLPGSARFIRFTGKSQASSGLIDSLPVGLKLEPGIQLSEVGGSQEKLCIHDPVRHFPGSSLR